MALFLSVSVFTQRLITQTWIFYCLDKRCSEAAGCKWNPDNNVKCGGNPGIFLLPEPTDKVSSAVYLTLSLGTVAFAGLESLSWLF